MGDPLSRDPGPAPRPECHSGRQLWALGEARAGADVPAWRREVRDEELRQFCARVSALLQKEEPGPEALDALRRLFLIVSATKYNRK